jgi:hypothetical protein
MNELLVLGVWITSLLLGLAVTRWSGKRQKRSRPSAMLVAMPGISQEQPLSYGQFLDRYYALTGVLPGFDRAASLYQYYLESYVVAVQQGEP